MREFGEHVSKCTGKKEEKLKPKHQNVYKKDNYNMDFE